VAWLWFWFWDLDGIEVRKNGGEETSLVAGFSIQK